MAEKLRIATVKATGEKFIVSVILDIGKPNSKVACLGNVVSYKQVNQKGECSWKYDGKRTFLRDAVEIEEGVDNSVALFDALVMQYIAHLRSKGHIVTFSKSGKTYTDHGTPKDIEARKIAQEKWNHEVASWNQEMRKMYQELGLDKYLKI